MRIGFFLSTEEFSPAQLVEQARAAEQAGFSGLWISDHFHPWNHEQGQSPFVWSVIGAIAEATGLPVTTAVTCPTVRTHPAIIAQAAATSAVMLEGRFSLGVGSGEALNEHIFGDAWPDTSTRLEMLEEAVQVIRQLWTGEVVNRHGRFYRLDRARLFTLPDEPPPILVSGFGPESTDVAARIGDGYINTAPDAELVGRFKSASGGKVVQAGAKVAWAPTVEEGVQIAHRLWANAGLPGELAQTLPTPEHFEQASQLVTEDATRASVVAGPDAATHLAQIGKYAEAGYDELYVSNMGPHYRQMIDFYGTRILPEVS